MEILKQPRCGCKQPKDGIEDSQRWVILARNRCFRRWKWWFARDFHGVKIEYDWHVWQFASLSWIQWDTKKEVVRVSHYMWRQKIAFGKSSHLWFSPQCFLFEMCGIVLIGQFFSTRFSARFTSCAAFPMTPTQWLRERIPLAPSPAWPPMAHEVLKFRRSMGQTRRMSMTSCMAGWLFGWTSEFFPQFMVIFDMEQEAPD